MSNMLEKVARAACAAHYAHCYGGEPTDYVAETDCDWRQFLPALRAALLAIRKPDDSMMVAACRASNADMLASWQAAIDAALPPTEI